MINSDFCSVDAFACLTNELMDLVVGVIWWSLLVHLKIVIFQDSIGVYPAEWKREKTLLAIHKAWRQET